jgi:nucleotide-binding universal stress UspA family protein
MQRENEFKEITEKLAKNDLANAQIHTIFRPRKKDIASEIINLNRETKFDVIVLNRKATRVTRFFSGSVSHKVLMTLKETTACIVS